MKTILIVTGISILIAMVPIIIYVGIMWKRAVDLKKEVDRAIKEYENA